MRSHLDLPSLEALQAEWRQHPPVHHLVAAYLDYKAPAANAQASQAELEGLLATVPLSAGAPLLDSAGWDSFINTSTSTQH